MSHEHPPTPESRKEIIDAIQELAEEQKIHNESPDPKDTDRLKRIEELQKFLRERNINPNNVPVDPKLHAEGAHGHAEDSHKENGHGEEAKKGFFKKVAGGIFGAGAVGGGLFTGILSMFMKSLVNTIRGKDGGGGGGGGGHGGGGHGGGGHH